MQGFQAGLRLLRQLSVGTWTSAPTRRTMKSTPTCSATSSRSTSTRSRWERTTPRRTSPATSPATRSSLSSSMPPRKSVRWHFGPDGGVWRCCGTTPTDISIPAVGHGIAWNARQPEAPIALKRPSTCPTTSPRASGTCPSAVAGTPLHQRTTPCPPRRGVRSSPAVSDIEEVRAKLASGDGAGDQRPHHT